MAILRSIDAVYTQTAVVLPAASAETLVLTSRLVQTPKDTNFVNVLAWCQFTLGTGVTSFTQRLRKGAALSGTLLNNPVNESYVAASGVGDCSLSYQEQDNFTDYVQFTYSLQANASTGAGNVNNAFLEVYVF